MQSSYHATNVNIMWPTRRLWRSSEFSWGPLFLPFWWPSATRKRQKRRGMRAAIATKIRDAYCLFVGFFAHGALDQKDIQWGLTVIEPLNLLLYCACKHVKDAKLKSRKFEIFWRVVVRKETIYRNVPGYIMPVGRFSEVGKTDYRKPSYRLYLYPGTFR